MRKWLLLPVFFLSVANLFAAQPPAGKKVYMAHRANPAVPVIDGRLDDPAWQSREWAGDFIQVMPYDGRAPSQQTAFKIIYDSDNLYVAIRAYDSEPDRIERRVTRRDEFDGDLVEINLDSYFDHRTAFSFTVTAAGVKGDEAVSEDGEVWDESWDPIWYTAVAIDEKGWTAEMRIPFSQLRFADKKEQVWGLQVTRQLFRQDERSVWQYIPKNAPGWVSYFGELHGIEGIHTSRRLELLPYTVGNLRRFQAEQGNPFATGQALKSAFGLDGKVGLTSDLTMDITVNPDFGQVEADPSEVNLSAFETFFEEKRPFFIEGQNILDYRIMFGQNSFSNDQLFYTRRIGRSPHHYPDIGAGQHLDRPQETSIISAVKITGKTRNGLSIGLLDAITAKEKATIDAQDQRWQETVEPFTNYLVTRLQKDYRAGATSIGGMFTATHRDLELHLNFLNRAAYTGGIDFRHQWKDRTYALDIRTAFSQIRGDEEAILRAQKSSARYFQRPDADYVTLDPTRTSLSGHGGYVTLGRFGNSPWRFLVGGMWRSPGLELNDLGFLRQADQTLEVVWVGYRSTNPVSIFRRINVNINQWTGWNFGGERLFSGGNINGGGQFKNYWSFWTGINREIGGLSTTTLRGGPALKTPGSWNQWYNIETDDRKALKLNFGGSNSWTDDGDFRSSVRFRVSYRPNKAMMIRINPFFIFNRDNLQYVRTVSLDDQNRYLFASIKQKTLGITIRMNYSLTPNLSIQYYGQPFVSAGQYSQFKRITNPRPARFEDRYHIFTGDEIKYDSEADQYHFDEDLDGTTDYSVGRPDFNFRQFRSNLIIRWEYTPGSTLFLVWSQERTGQVGDGTFSFAHDLGGLFDQYPTNVFLVKFNHWFSL